MDCKLVLLLLLRGHPADTLSYVIKWHLNSCPHPLCF